MSKRLEMAAALSSLLVGSFAPSSATAAEPTRWRWTQITPQAGEAPSPRRNGTAVWDAPGRRVVVFGGTGASGTLNDVWAFNVDSRTWSRVQTTGSAPAPRLGHDAIFDPVGRRMIVWAGQGSGFFNDTWSLDLSTNAWTRLSPSSPPLARYGSASVYDPVDRNLVMFGGFTTSGRFRDTQALTLATPAWTDVTPSGVRPVERCLHTAAFQREGRRLILYGGQMSGPLDDLWAFDIGARAWTQLTPTSQRPSGRFFTNSFVAGDGRFYSVFGSTSAGNVSEIWSFDFTRSEWTRVDVAGAPAPRNGALGAFIEDENRLIVFGGTGSQLFGEVWELAAEGPAAAAETWILPSSARAPGAGGAFFTTGLSAVNTGAAAASLTMKFLGHDQDGRTGPEKTFTLAPGQSMTWSDLLGGVFELTEGFGAVRVTANSPSLAVLSQTSTPAPGGGTFGQAVAPLRTAEAIAAGVSRTIPFVREDASFRTNLILANAGEAGLDVEVALISPTGSTLGSKTYTLPPLGMTQVSRVVRDLGVTNALADARLVVSTPTAGGIFAAYAALIDNTTNDARTLVPR